MQRSVPRRRLLAGSAGTAATAALAGTIGAGTLLGLAGCDELRGREPAADPPPDPLEPLLTGKADVLAHYDRATARFPALASRLTPLRADHAAHLAALREVLDPRRRERLPATPGPATSGTGAVPGTSATPPPATVRSALAGLAVAEQAAAARSTAACLAAQGARAALLGSIAACETSHLVVLGGR